ncbi:hypothetical protein ACFWBF_28185 [Streptomyces sp. NPDC060028]|uniref:hypothetical protein n=1 Tax=Streptomyces sp. NPDC060028 TaxID=3347041 RepID=UPI00367BCA3B
MRSTRTRTAFVAALGTVTAVCALTLGSAATAAASEVPGTAPVQEVVCPVAGPIAGPAVGPVCDINDENPWS